MAAETRELDDLMEVAMPGFGQMKTEALRDTMVDALLMVVAPEVQVTKILKPQAIGQLMLKGLKERLFMLKHGTKEVLPQVAQRQKVEARMFGELMEVPQEEFSKVKNVVWDDYLTATGTQGQYRVSDKTVAFSPMLAGKGTGFHEFGHVGHWNPGKGEFNYAAGRMSEADVGNAVFGLETKTLEALQDMLPGQQVMGMLYHMSPIEEVANVTMRALGKEPFRQGLLKGLQHGVRKGAENMRNYWDSFGQADKAKEYDEFLKEFMAGKWK